jgi:hypothetical protein
LHEIIGCGFPLLYPKASDVPSGRDGSLDHSARSRLPIFLAASGQLKSFPFPAINIPMKTLNAANWWQVRI